VGAIKWTYDDEDVDDMNSVAINTPGKLVVCFEYRQLARGYRKTKRDSENLKFRGDGFEGVADDWEQEEKRREMGVRDGS
jgi:hypothetical protein